VEDGVASLAATNQTTTNSQSGSIQTDCLKPWLF